ncbi:MAG TPA: hypothetical protein GX512_04560 [Firmicutes bacterium]|nr:hypothetical protein [Candidatus Fermentithermobacillaceae bacterium]
MVEDRIIKECTKSFGVEGREFTVKYVFCEEDANGHKRFVIRAVLKEAGSTGLERESSASVELIYLHPEIGRRIFDTIAGAEDPVFPVHLGDIVRDQIAATSLMEVRQS